MKFIVIWCLDSCSIPQHPTNQFRSQQSPRHKPIDPTTQSPHPSIATLRCWILESAWPRSDHPVGVLPVIQDQLAILETEPELESEVRLDIAICGRQTRSFVGAVNLSPGHSKTLPYPTSAWPSQFPRQYPDHRRLARGTPSSSA